MSTYQYYEFRKIESSLSDKAMQEISDLSSRAQVSRTSASFTYNYSDFPSDPIKVLTNYRPLFLSWLQAAFLEHGWDPDAALPPVPPGLRELSDRHRALIDLFEIDSDLVAAAASVSDPIRRVSNEDLAQAIESMPAAQQAGFLRRMVLGEPPSVVLAELRGQLRSGPRCAKASIAAPLPSPPSAAVLFAKARQMQADGEREARERKAALKLQRLEAIERDEKGLWRRVDELIAGKTVKAYDQAVGILKDLRALAVHTQRMEDFLGRIEGIRAKYPRLSGLQWRIKNAKLLEGLESN